MLLQKQQFTDGQLHLTAVAFDDIDDFDWVFGKGSDKRQGPVFVEMVQFVKSGVSRRRTSTISRARCAECIYKVVQQHNLGDVAIQFRTCVQKLHSHNSERIIKIDPRLTKLC